MSEGNPYFGATFAERKAARLASEGKPAPAEAKAVSTDEDAVEDKAVVPTQTGRKSAKKR